MNEQINTTIERARALLAKADWYAYDPENGTEWHGTEAEAKADALAALESFRDASPGGWHEDVGSIQWGLLIPFEQVEEIDRVETPDAEFDYQCDYAMKPHPLGEVFATLCDMADAIERRAVEAEAGAAAMRSCVDRLNELASNGIQSSGPLADLHPAILASMVEKCERALAADAGRAILDRLERTEAERDALRAEKYAHAVDREVLGQKVREVWIEWAMEQPAAKASWLVPWDGLAEPDKEVDRRIGERLTWGLRAENTELATEVRRLRAERDQLRKDWDNALSVSTAHFQGEIRALKAELATERAKVRKAKMCDACRLNGCVQHLSNPACHDCGGSGAVIVEDGK